ncbi:hypothetical protein [Saccharothrix syringae]|uniref:Uncharacterized protein n=1 Tax=Saccharothrix syringae TaxID=103733 RepID=A0A5Q0GWY0_SACSY|nr:hypothetical protein [Saccharothrix syringae]QFZ18557.1 hypothetical protein EKG83_14790 [Saccharothrix syringae]
MITDDAFWALPGEDPLTVARTAGPTEALLTVSTTIPSLSALRLTGSEEDALLRRAWDLAAGTGAFTSGKRLSWRGFLFTLAGDGPATARAVLAALRGDASLRRMVWRVVGAEIGSDWRVAFDAVQARLPERTAAMWVRDQQLVEL